MTVLISAHQDKVKNHLDLSFRDGKHTGLLDNWLGILVTYMAFYDDPTFSILERED